MVTLIGMSALKSGLFHERMAFNAQAEELTFQAAETAINSVLGEARTRGALLTDIYNGGGTPTDHCITNSGGLEDGQCEADQTLDARSSIQAAASSVFEVKRPLFDTDASSFMDYQFATEGAGGFVQGAAMPFANRNYQAWRKVGPSSGQFSDDSGLLDYGNGGGPQDGGEEG